MSNPTELLEWVLEAMRTRSRIWTEMRDLPGAPEWIRDVRVLLSADTPAVTMKLVTPMGYEPAREAIRLLEELPGIELEVAYCPESVREWFQCPFLRCEDGQTHFGLDGIKFFISEYLEVLDAS